MGRLAIDACEKKKQRHDFMLSPKTHQRANDMYSLV